MNYWQQEIETMPREELRRHQSEKLVWQVRRMYEKLPYFRERMDKMGLKPDDIHGVEDLHRLPFTYKQDLRDF